VHFPAGRVSGLQERETSDGLVVDVYTGEARVSVQDDLYEELTVRLDRFAAPDAARRLQDDRFIRREDKPVVREVLARWRRSVGTEPVAEQLWELQTRLR